MPSARSDAPAIAGWADVLREFRALGGVADNVELRHGAHGMGLFPVVPGERVCIAVPPNLLVDVRDVVFVDHHLRVREGAAMGPRERAFFERYERDFSWGGGGKQECEAFFAAVDALPKPVRDVLAGDLGLTLFAESKGGAARIRERFLRARNIVRDNQAVLMPVLDLVNHSRDGCGFDIAGGVSIAGTFAGEVLAHYGMIDPYGAFSLWGFAGDEPVAFSLPATLDLGSRRLVIARELSNKTVRGIFNVPVMDADSTQVRISHLMLGHERYPRLAKGVFYQFMKEIGEANAEALFDSIRRFNIGRFLDLLDAIDSCEGPLIRTLRAMCRHQIRAITHSIGSREL